MGILVLQDWFLSAVVCVSVGLVWLWVTADRLGHLVDVSPVLAVVVEAFPHHGHDLAEGHHAEGQLGDLRHQRAGRTPGVVGGRLPHLDLRIRIVVHDVLHLSPEGRGRHGDGVSVCVGGSPASRCETRQTVTLTRARAERKMTQTGAFTLQKL